MLSISYLSFMCIYCSLKLFLTFVCSEMHNMLTQHRRETLTGLNHISMPLLMDQFSTTCCINHMQSWKNSFHIKTIKDNWHMVLHNWPISPFSMDSSLSYSSSIQCAFKLSQLKQSRMTNRASNLWKLMSSLNP